MKKQRVYHPQPPEEEQFPPCPVCGCGRIKALDNWLVTPCIRALICQGCGRKVLGEGETIAECKADALKKWRDQDEGGLPPWDDESVAAGMTAEE